MKLTIVAVGRDKKDPFVQAAGEYVERIAHYYAASMVEVKEEPATKSTPADRVKAAEGERLLAACPEGARIIALDERGTALSSPELAQRLGRWTQSAQSLCFLVGGPLGHAPATLEAAHERWSLSKLTLPHRLARLILAEQLYRACTILRGEPYHK